ncbi:hypothetical protein B0H65DRAFT_176612 [Neurospora tetraspora]|uniref:DUF1996 domain-containing protein n=1 Tax=Neurospora tetraspora TaxID=94610 RepID=A0AAE0JIX3_9PEZI|nr:hypothetical protein B0H65DRAFT_176612 [Neurospora tetraspora]
MILLTSLVVWLTCLFTATSAQQPTDCIKPQPTSQAFFVMGCGKPITVDRLDPIVSPGRPSQHLHTVMGGSAFDFDLDYNKTQTSNRTTCSVSKDLSNYWVPTVYFHDKKNHTFTAVEQVGGINVYYQERMDWTDYCAGQELLAFPKGFKMIAGDTTRRAFNSSRVEDGAVEFICLLTNNEPGLPPFSGFPNRTCDGGLQIRIRFPSCWDGVGLGTFSSSSSSSPNSNSNSNSTGTASAYNNTHVTYPSRLDTGTCPPTHRYRIPALLYEMTWAVDAFNHLRTPGDQPFVFSNGDKTGYGYHADFFNGWDVDLLQKAIRDPSCGNETGGRIERCGSFREFLQSNEVQNQIEGLEQKVEGEWKGVLEGGELPGGVRVGE